MRDAFHPEDLADLVMMQIRRDPPEKATYNVGGGTRNAMSLAQLTAWCDQRFGKHKPSANGSERPFDIPWLIVDSERVNRDLGWQPRRSLASILDEIAVHVQENPGWLERCGAV